MSEIRIGQNTWSKGSHRSDKTRKKMSESLKGHAGVPHSEETKRKMSEMFKGRSIPIEIREKMSKTHKGMKLTPEHCAKISAAHKGMKYSDSTKSKLRVIWETRSEEYKKRIVKQMLTISIPNKKETQLMELLDSFYPGEWKFVGYGQLIINGKCPDFVNVNGQKKIIEFWGDHWHRGENPQDRANIFKPFGYETLIIRESELKDIEETIEKIRTFCESGVEEEKEGKKGIRDVWKIEFRHKEVIENQEALFV